MPSIPRRQFLQYGGATLATLGISQFQMQQHMMQYGSVLAQPSRRKRALLVGINAYPGSKATDFKTRGLWYRLRGAVNDVELQRELLVHRFGFHPDDILVLTDQAATREQILNAFEQHLIQWAQSDQDVVVFHYSGHGSTVIDPNQVFSDGLNGTLVPVDGFLPDRFPQGGGEVNDITAGTLFLLREALGRKTKNVTFILDSCYSGAGVRGNLIARSRPGQFDLRGATPKTKLEVSQKEVEYQERWLKTLGLSEDQWIERRRTNQVGGVAIFAAQRNQQALDAAFAPDVHAGLFTYALTRQLWQQTSNQAMGKIIIAASAKTEQFLKESRSQKPGYEVQQKADEQQPMYFTLMQKPAAEAVVTEAKGKTVKLLLTGVEPEILDAMGKGAVFTLVDDAGKPRGSVQIQSRDRLTATGILTTNSAMKINLGASLQEQVRAVPTDLKLRIGVDPSLDEMAATKQLRSRPRLQVVPLSEDVNYILGRMIPDYQQLLAKSGTPNLPAMNSIGLFGAGLEPIPGSFGDATETVERAIARLQAKFRLLLATRLIKMTLNTNSSRLNVVASLKPVDQQALLAQTFTMRGPKTQAFTSSVLASSTGDAVAQVPINKSVQIIIENRESHDLHMGVMIFSPDGAIDVMFPLVDGKNAALVSAGQTLKIPSDVDLQQGANLAFGEPLGLAEMLVVASTEPITQALRPIQALAAEKQNPQRTQSQTAEKTEDVVASFLDDLAGGKRSGSTFAPVRKLDVRQMAALSITFEIVESPATT